MLDMLVSEEEVLRVWKITLNSLFIIIDICILRLSTRT